MVTRCVCYNVRFAELKKIAAKHKATSIEELQRHVRFGENCKRCHQYVLLMLETGRTVFEVIPLEEEQI